jgi:hypothetical protein
MRARVQRALPSSHVNRFTPSGGHVPACHKSAPFPEAAAMAATLLPSHDTGHPSQIREFEPFPDHLQAGHYAQATVTRTTGSYGALLPSPNATACTPHERPPPPMPQSSASNTHDTCTPHERPPPPMPQSSASNTHDIHTRATVLYQNLVTVRSRSRSQRGDHDLGPSADEITISD